MDDLVIKDFPNGTWRVGEDTWSEGKATRVYVSDPFETAEEALEFHKGRRAKELMEEAYASGSSAFKAGYDAS